VAPPEAIRCPQPIGAAFVGDAVEEPAELDSSLMAYWVSQGERSVLVLALSEAVDRAGYQLVDRLAELTDSAHLNGSAIFFDTRRTRQLAKIDTERLLLRGFRKAAGPAEELAFLNEWGPLDLPSHPRDVWRTPLSECLHLDAIDALLREAAERHPRDGDSCDVGLPGRELTVEGYAMELQGLTFAVYQAVVITLVKMVLEPNPDSLRDGFGSKDLEARPSSDVVLAWRERALPEPPTTGEALDTVIALLVRASGAFTPGIEVRSTSADDPWYWHLATGILGALALQAIHAVSDSAPVRPCKRCGELFQRRLGERPDQRGQGTERVKFCSDRCARADAQSKYRARLLAENGQRGPQRAQRGTGR
jgi:hypothetical protein